METNNAAKPKAKDEEGKKAEDKKAAPKVKTGPKGAKDDESKSLAKGKKKKIRDNKIGTEAAHKRVEKETTTDSKSVKEQSKDVAKGKKPTQPTQIAGEKCKDETVAKSSELSLRSPSVKQLEDNAPKSEAELSANVSSVSGSLAQKKVLSTMLSPNKKRLVVFSDKLDVHNVPMDQGQPLARHQTRMDFNPDRRQIVLEEIYKRGGYVFCDTTQRMQYIAPGSAPPPSAEQFEDVCTEVDEPGFVDPKDMDAPVVTNVRQQQNDGFLSLRSTRGSTPQSTKKK